MASNEGVVVGVVAWEIPESSGGFNWYATSAAADAALPVVATEMHEDGIIISRFDARVTSHEAATQEIDNQWEEWQQYPATQAATGVPVDLRGC